MSRLQASGLCPGAHRTARRWGIVAALLAAPLLPTLLPTPVVSPAGAQAPPPVPTTAPGTPPTTTAPTPPTAADPALSTWSVSPTGKDPSAPSERTNFSYELAPGTSADDSATVWNYSDSPRVFDVYARDAFATKGGGVDLLTKDKQNADLGGWLALSTEQVTVPARSGVTVPFSVTAPRNALPGDHDAGIVVSLTTQSVGPDKNAVLVDHRIALRVYLRVTGPLNPVLVIDQVGTTYAGTPNPFGKGDVDVTYTVRNTGNIRLKGHQSIALQGLFGWRLAEHTPVDVPELLPGASVTLSEHFEGIPPAIRLSPTINLTPFVPAGGDIPNIEPVAASAPVWAIPWTLLALVVTALIALRFVRRRRRRAKPEATRRRGSGPDGRGPSKENAPIAAADADDEADAIELDDLLDETDAAHDDEVEPVGAPSLGSE